MIFMLRGFLAPIIATLTSIFLSISALFGVTEAPVRTPDSFENVKNVIYLIGDGMGPLHLEMAKDLRDITLTMDTFEIEGRSQTRSASSSVTDSAAGATALACGVRTFNGALGVYTYDILHVESHPKSLTELCIEKGMKTGVVTTDSTSGATPSGFSVHTDNRNNTKDIDNQQMKSDIDLIWGGTSEYVTQEKCEEIFNVLKEEKISRCYYGHLHGYSCQSAVNGEYEGIKFSLISADYLEFCPKLVEKTP